MCNKPARRCPGRASMPTEPGQRVVGSLRVTRQHDHEPNMIWIVVEEAGWRMLQRSQVEATGLRDIHREELQRIPNEAAIQLPFNLIANYMQRLRSRALGPVPNTLEEYGAALEGNPRFGRTVYNDEFYRATLVDEAGDTAIVFTSPSVSNLLDQATHAHIDATFKVVPVAPPCYQLLTVAVILFDHAFPAVSVLMGRKTERLYNLVFAFIKQEFPEWQPQVFTTDFERGLQNAIRAAWPASAVVGCWFHSANCMNKKAKRLGLTNLIRNNDDVRRIYKMCQALPLLPAEQVEEGYDAIVARAEETGVLINVTTFLNYIHRVWVTGIGAHSMSVFRQRRRTNNDMEAYHRNLLRPMHHAHPNVWNFTDGLRSMEHEAATTLGSLQLGRLAVRPLRPNYILSNRTIVRLTDSLVEGHYSPREFLEAASHQLDGMHDRLYNERDDDSDGNSPDEAAQVGRGWLPPDPVPAVRDRRQRQGAAVGGKGRGRGRRRARGAGRGRRSCNNQLQQDAAAIDAPGLVVGPPPATAAPGLVAVPPPAAAAPGLAAPVLVAGAPPAAAAPGLAAPVLVVGAPHAAAAPGLAAPGLVAGHPPAAAAPVLVAGAPPAAAAPGLAAPGLVAGHPLAAAAPGLVAGPPHAAALLPPAAAQEIHDVEEQAPRLQRCQACFVTRRTWLYSCPVDTWHYAGTVVNGWWGKMIGVFCAENKLQCLYKCTFEKIICV